MSKKRLGLVNHEVVDRDFDNSPVERSVIDKYGKIHRGSVRMIRGLFRTEAEQDQFIKRGLKAKLPGSHKRCRVM